jgi:lipid-A-disaccharide synthase
MAKVRRRVDRLACILPFEPDYFRPHGIAAEFVGHPIFEPLVTFQPDVSRIAKLPTGSPNLKIALLPGSRSHEITRHLPAQLRVAAAIQRNHPAASFVVATPPPGHGHSLDVARLLAESPTPVTWATRLGDGSSVGLHDVLAWADLVLTVSGSVTLEVAWFAKPMVVMYHATKWQWNLIGRLLLRAPFLSLPNIVAGRKVVPELMPWFGQDQPIIAELESLIADPARQEAMRSDLRALVQPLATQHASRRVAQIAADMIQNRMGE